MPSLKIGQQKYPAYWKGRIFLLDQWQVILFHSRNVDNTPHRKSGQYGAAYDRKDSDF